MTDVKLASNGNLRIWYIPLGGIANPSSPTAPEINAGIDISDAVSWNDYAFGFQASAQNSDPAITAKGRVSTRGATAFGGTISFYYPKNQTDITNKLKIVQDALDQPGTQGYLVVRVDGEELRSGSATTAQPAMTAAANDLVHVFKIVTDAQADSITGEDAFRWTQTFVSQGFAIPNAVVRASSSAPAVAITPLTATMSIASPTHPVLKATVNTRNLTRAVVWASSDQTKVTVSQNGVLSIAPGATAGSVNITATDPRTGTLSAAPSVVTLGA